MPKLLQVDFPFSGPFGAEMTKALADLAESITKEPGFIWKIWTENAAEKEAGGIYLFENEATAKAYLEMHSARLKELGVAEVRSRIYDVNADLSKVTNAKDLTNF
ncbi:monooxygenase [Marinospirillum insulare]|uniref:Monooxygenase n=1 Tax=Marinospirillum insulare TaxID=217169 RepID=A0ABQ5ZTT9_9GAMM|nr:monooxygenase [Marinospirillum insulare]GLR62852.1 monooxygenase [Marinospirillum insulare]